jgi:hypothetical protein
MTGHEATSTAAGTATGTTGPRPLSLTGASRDGAALLLTDEAGTAFVLDITPRLRAALRGDASRNGKVETTMDSTLRPRDIQARIRAGETAEAVAEAARTSLDKIMPFAGPVLAERQHVAERAQRSSVRRRVGEPAGTSRTLGEAVDAHLRGSNVDPDLVGWDAWRREDGRWCLVADFELPTRTGSAHFTFDVPGNYVMLDDDDARWLVGESVAAPAPVRDDLHSARERRLGSPAADEELPLGDDAIELVHEEAPLPLEAFFSEPLERSEHSEHSEHSEPTEVTEPAEPAVVVDPPEDAPAPRRPVQKKKGRASVPSWDEIMFGGDSST